MNAVTNVRNIKVFQSEDRHTQKAKLSILLLIVFSIATTGHFVLCRLKPVFIQEAASLDNSVEMRMVKVKKTIKAWKSCHVMCLGQILKYFSYLSYSYKSGKKLNPTFLIKCWKRCLLSFVIFVIKLA